MSLLVDTHESPELFLSFSQLLDTEKADLNPELGDIVWVDAQGDTHSVEGKQAGEILGGLDSVEEQLSREIRAGRAQHYYLAIRGLAIPSPEGIKVMRQAENGYWYQERVFHYPYHTYRSKLVGFQRMGVTVWELPTTEAFVQHIVAQYRNDQKAAHRTFQKHIVVKPWMLAPQPAVLSVMGIAGAQAGEEIAMALVGRKIDHETGEIISEPQYPSLSALFNANPGDIARVRLASGRRIGPAFEARFFRAIGREI